MTNLRLIALTGAVLSTVALTLAACSEDTVVTPIDGGGDAGGDGSASDASKPDATPDATADADANADAGLTVENYIPHVGETFCKAIARCCFGDPNTPDGGAVPGGHYNQNKCVTVLQKVGFENTNAGIERATPGNVVLDQAEASSCLAKMEALDCNLTGAKLRDVRSTCYAALTGKVALGGACNASIECEAGAFCKPSDAADAGAGGVCTKLAGTGGVCGTQFNTGSDDTDFQAAEEVCSSRGAGDTGLHCASFEYTTPPDGNYLASRDDWKCQTGVANGQGCNYTTWCATGICDGTDYTCKDPFEALAQACEVWVTPSP